MATRNYCKKLCLSLGILRKLELEISKYSNLCFATVYTNIIRWRFAILSNIFFCFEHINCTEVLQNEKRN